MEKSTYLGRVSLREVTKKILNAKVTPDAVLRTTLIDLEFLYMYLE
jgi:hypothetical protein